MVRIITKKGKVYENIKGVVYEGGEPYYEVGCAIFTKAPYTLHIPLSEIVEIVDENYKHYKLVE